MPSPYEAPMVGEHRTFFEIEIERDGIWPTVWAWRVVKRLEEPGRYVARTTYEGSRLGFAFTKDGARRKALKAKRSMQVDDVKVLHEV